MPSVLHTLQSLSLQQQQAASDHAHLYGDATQPALQVVQDPSMRSVHRYANAAPVNTNNHSSGGSESEEDHSALSDILGSRRRRDHTSSSQHRQNGGRQPQPGTRQYRRYLNTHLSDYDTESELSEDEADYKIVDFEHEPVFNKAPELFDDRATTEVLQARVQKKLKGREERAYERAKRRAEKLSKSGVVGGSKSVSPNNKRAAAGKTSPSSSSTVDKQSLTSSVEQLSLVDRSVMTTSPSMTGNTTDSLQDELHGNLSVTDDSEDDDLLVVDTEQSHSQQVFNDTYAQELYQLIDKSLRKIYLGMHDFTYMLELESVLIPWKQSLLTASEAVQMSPSTFTIQKYKPSASSAKPSTSKHHHHDLMITFIDPFHLWLATGCAQFHNLPFTSVRSAGSHSAIIRRPEHSEQSPPPHSISLLSQIHAHQRAKAADDAARQRNFKVTPRSDNKLNRSGPQRPARRQRVR